MDKIDSSSLKGRHVIDNAGADVGAVDEIEIDPKTWGVSGIVVKVRRDVVDRLPLSKPLMGEPRVTFSTDRVQSLGDNVLLNLNMSDIAGYLSEQ